MVKTSISTKVRVIAHYNFKPGMEEKGAKFVEKEIFDLLRKHGATDTELFQSSDNPAHFFSSADWHSLEDAKSAQNEWESKTKELQSFCTSAPKREFYHLKAHH